MGIMSSKNIVKLSENDPNNMEICAVVANEPQNVKIRDKNNINKEILPKSQIIRKKLINRKKIRLTENTLLAVECPICCDYIAYNSVSMTPCGHVFCSGCINKAKALSRACPVCRKFLTPRSIRPLMLTERNIDVQEVLVDTD